MPTAADEIELADVKTFRKFAARCRLLSASVADWKTKDVLIAVAIELENAACELEAQMERRYQNKKGDAPP